MTRELSVGEGGASNSRPVDISVNESARAAWRVSAVGVDTVAYRFRGVYGARSRLRELAQELGANYWTGKQGETVAQDKGGGIRVSAFDSGLVSCEGRLAQFVQDRESHELLGRGDLIEGGSAAALNLGDLVGGDDELSDAAIGRIDLASELRFSDARDGRDLLQAVAGMGRVPWGRIAVEHGPDGLPATVYVKSANGKTVLDRIYDKGLESGSAPRFERIRVEHQGRFRKPRELAVGELAVTQLERRAVGKVAALRESGDAYSVSVAGAARLVVESLQGGDLTQERAAQLIGFAVLNSELGDRLKGTRGSREERWFYRQRSAMQRIGISGSECSGYIARRVPLNAYLTAIEAAWCQAA